MRSREFHWSNHQTQEGDWFRWSGHSADLCWYLPQPGMDCPPKRQVSKSVEPFYDLYVVNKYTIHLIRICAIKFVDFYGKTFFFFVLFCFCLSLIKFFRNVSYLIYQSYVYVYRQVVAWHRPYCVDLEESTFSHLRSFLERYCDGINNEIPPLPFPSSKYVFYHQH